MDLVNVKNSLFLFEVVIERVNSFVQSRFLVVRGEFSDIFSVDLRDPKQMHIVIPEPPPLPPEPVGKKGKKKKKPPKPKKGKKGKKGAVELPPPEPEILSGQSVLFGSSPEVLTQAMKSWPLVVSLWSKENDLIFIGSITVPWDPVFLIYLQKVYNCEEPPPPVVKDDYNIFQERTAKLMAKITMQVKLTYLTDKVVSSFRTLSEDAGVRKMLYTGMNSKVTSYMCTLKTTDEEFESNWTKFQNNYVKAKPMVPTTKPVVFADYKNVPGAQLPFLNDEELCCMNLADKPPESKYTSPETCPDINYICDYVRKIITSCNDNMRMLTPRPTIRPRIKATDIDRLCYCRETSWPQGKLAERFRRETQGGPCPICIRDKDGKPRKGSISKVFDIANIRGPCGRPECRIARDMRAYIENLVDEDNVVVNVEDIIGPCGSRSCTLVDKIKDFINHRGVFSHGGANIEGLPTQCACLDLMQKALVRKGSCDSVCSHDCEDPDSDSCGGKACPHRESPKASKSAVEPTTQVYQVFYFTVELDDPSKPSTPKSGAQSQSQTPTQDLSRSGSPASVPAKKFKFCAPECPTMADEEPTCALGVCKPGTSYRSPTTKVVCVNDTCPIKEKEGVERELSPADSDLEIDFKEIHNLCCVKSCEVADKVKDLIVEGYLKTSKKPSCMDDAVDPCYCACECSFKLGAKTTYCAVCGGYECLGDDTRAQPAYAQPHPCPVYHKLYDKAQIKTQSPWPEDDMSKQAADNVSSKGGKTPSSKGVIQARSAKNLAETKVEAGKEGKKKTKKKVGKFTANTDQGSVSGAPQEFKHALYCNAAQGGTIIKPVPKNMGWLWNAEDIPGLKFRPKWKPGAVNRILVRRYRTVREGVDIIAKKKRAMMQRKKKIEMKPTLVVKKQDGEYTVQMEVFKKYSKDRFLYQYPYDEKPPLIYTIGKTEETKQKIQKQRERRERRETRRKSRLLQSTFRDKCQEICLKAYNQAIGLLPLPNPNNPDCPCDVEAIKQPSPVVDSCSCSEEGTISSSDTDGDDWIIEFTPPLARWDAKAKHLPAIVDNECQYNYLDFKVKLFDKQGNPVPRYFKGPDGKQECSDLGGFWSPEHLWLEINKDGYIGPDNRWVPVNFTGPDGMFYLSEEGHFTDSGGKVWRIGIDGYVDKDGKWAFYSKRRIDKSARSISTMTGTTADTRKTGNAGKGAHKTPDQAPVKGVLSKKPAGKTADSKKTVAVGAAPTTANTSNEKGKTKKTVTVGGRGKAPVVMTAAMAYDYNRRQREKPQQDYNMQREAKKIAHYQEIMQELKIYDDVVELRPQVPAKTNRASNTAKPATTTNFDRKVIQPLLTAKSSMMQRSTATGSQFI
ncbi:uncharacterized protein LOC126367668 [Pectinophora gossypiella]|uniref:uncharacterized protein LOC126367668 n=1 Tax=Pectinophora gossypiella TaxID=13191 RepID=UPI00214E441C|nr:uncharacterized protein LOC126367668 [Pectinophora gossypiella]